MELRVDCRVEKVCRSRQVEEGVSAVLVPLTRAWDAVLKLLLQLLFLAKHMPSGWKPLVSMHPSSEQQLQSNCRAWPTPLELVLEQGLPIDACNSHTRAALMPAEPGLEGTGLMVKRPWQVESWGKAPHMPFWVQQTLLNPSTTPTPQSFNAGLNKTFTAAHNPAHAHSRKP